MESVSFPFLLHSCVKMRSKQALYMNFVFSRLAGESLIWCAVVKTVHSPGPVSYLGIIVMGVIYCPVMCVNCTLNVCCKRFITKYNSIICPALCPYIEIFMFHFQFQSDPTFDTSD